MGTGTEISETCHVEATIEAIAPASFGIGYLGIHRLPKLGKTAFVKSGLSII